MPKAVISGGYIYKGGRQNEKYADYLIEDIQKNNTRNLYNKKSLDIGTI